MENFGCIVKTYEKDFQRVKDLTESFVKFCTDQTRLCIIVPDHEEYAFKSLERDNVIVIPESRVPVCLVQEEINGIRPGYINQELIKLSFWKTQMFKNYLCLDSDGIFIRNFNRSDFMYSENEPYTVMVDDKDLMSQPNYRAMWEYRERNIRKIYDEYSLPQPQYVRTTHGFQVLSSLVLKDMEANFLQPRNLTYLDLLRISPYEFSWYTLYLVKKGGTIRQTEPFFKYYHDSLQYLSDIILGVNVPTLSKGYVGLVLNSNFQPGNKQINLGTDKGRVLSYYLSTSEILKALLLKFPLLIFHFKVLLYKMFQKLNRG